MIHLLTVPIRTNTHARITSIREAPGSGIVVHYQLGTVDLLEGFVADELIPEVRRFLRAPEAETMRDIAAAAGAPVTEGVQEWRRSDLLDHLDTEGWEPL